MEKKPLELKKQKIIKKYLLYLFIIYFINYGNNDIK